jgi:hypothetical protein
VETRSFLHSSLPLISCRGFCSNTIFHGKNSLARVSIRGPCDDLDRLRSSAVCTRNGEIRMSQYYLGLKSATDLEFQASGSRMPIPIAVSFVSMPLRIEKPESNLKISHQDTKSTGRVRGKFCSQPKTVRGAFRNRCRRRQFYSVPRNCDAED